MTKLSVIAAGAVAVACVSVALLGSGVSAAAPDVVGMKYYDAKAKLNEANLTPVVATVVGDRLPQN
jgi:beta-lactam-binding protein with PASTA domain